MTGQPTPPPPYVPVPTETRFFFSPALWRETFIVDIRPLIRPVHAGSIGKLLGGVGWPAQKNWHQQTEPKNSNIGPFLQWGSLCWKDLFCWIQCYGCFFLVSRRNFPTDLRSQAFLLGFYVSRTKFLFFMAFRSPKNLPYRIFFPTKKSTGKTSLKQMTPRLTFFMKQLQPLAKRLAEEFRVCNPAQAGWRLKKQGFTDAILRICQDSVHWRGPDL